MLDDATDRNLATMSPSRLLLMLPLLLSLSGCVVAVGNSHWDDDEDDWKKRERTNREAIADLELGLRRSTVIEEMGEPDFNDAFMRGDTEYVVLRYRTQRVKSDGMTTRDETTPLVFVDGNLVGWGDAAIEHAIAP